MRVNLGTLDVTDEQRRALAKMLGCTGLASRDDVTTFVNRTLAGALEAAVNAYAPRASRAADAAIGAVASECDFFAVVNEMRRKRGVDPVAIAACTLAPHVRIEWTDGAGAHCADCCRVHSMRLVGMLRGDGLPLHQTVIPAKPAAVAVGA